MNKEFKQQLSEMYSLMNRMEEKIHNTIYYPSYEVINEAKSFGGAFKVKNLGDIVSAKDKCLVNEGIDWDIENENKGGIIVFSTDVNAVQLSQNKIVNWIKQKYQTLDNRINATDKIDQIADKNELIGWTIGHYLNGRYKAKNGKIYGENSLSLELVGIEFDQLIKIAEEICREFLQESVLVKSYETGKILFVDPK